MSRLRAPVSGRSHMRRQDGLGRDTVIAEKPVGRLERRVRTGCLREALVWRPRKPLDQSDEPRSQPFVAKLSRLDLATDVHGEGRSHPAERRQMCRILRREPLATRDLRVPGARTRGRRRNGPGYLCPNRTAGATVRVRTARKVIANKTEHAVSQSGAWITAGQQT